MAKRERPEEGGEVIFFSQKGLTMEACFVLEGEGTQWFFVVGPPGLWVWRVSRIVGAAQKPEHFCRFCVAEDGVWVRLL